MILFWLLHVLGFVCGLVVWVLFCEVWVGFKLVVNIGFVLVLLLVVLRVCSLFGVCFLVWFWFGLGGVLFLIVGTDVF